MCMGIIFSDQVNNGKFDIVQNPVVRIAQNALHFTTLADLFNQTPYLNFSGKHPAMLQLMHGCCSYTYPPLSIVRYSYS